MSLSTSVNERNSGDGVQWEHTAAATHPAFLPASPFSPFATLCTPLWKFTPSHYSCSPSQETRLPPPQWVCTWSSLSCAYGLTSAVLSAHSPCYSIEELACEHFPCLVLLYIPLSEGLFFFNKFAELNETPSFGYRIKRASQLTHHNLRCDFLF